jgi:energy-coupling factor transport system ATP-binding protein
VLKRGEVLGIIGPTGSGKSTLVAIMSGLMKPTHGKVIFDNIDVFAGRGDYRIDRDAKRLRIGVVFQYPEHCLFEDTVEKDAAFGPLAIGLDEAAALERARKALDEVGLDLAEIAGRSPFELSGGQRRKAAIAGVLALDPEVLILDEPTAGLDPVSARAVRNIVEKRVRTGGSTVLVTHDLEYLAETATSVALLVRGKVVRLDSTAEILGDADLLKSSGLEPPTAVLFSSMLLGQKAGGKRVPLTIKEAAEIAGKWVAGACHGVS